MELKQLENSSMELTLTLSAQEIEDAYKKSMTDYSKKLTMKGFRQGKAPISLIESKYGKEIREDITFKLMEEKLEASYKDMDTKQRPLPYSTPVLQNEETLLPFQPNTDVTYSVIYDVFPTFELPAYTDLDVKYEIKKVTKEEVTAQIEKLREQNAMVIEKQGDVAKNDIVTIDYAELDQDGNTLEANSREDFTFTVGNGYNFYQLDDEIIGMKKGEVKVIEKTYGDDSGMGTDYLGKTIKIQVTMKNVKVRELPELDDEFAQDVKDEYKTLDDLKKATKEQLEKEAEETNKGAKLTAVLKAVSEATKMDIPQSMVESQLEQEWKNFVNRFGMTEEQVLQFLAMQQQTKEQFLEGMREGVVEKLKQELILDAIQTAQKFEVSAEEIAEAMKNFGDDIKEDDPNYSLYKNYAEDDVKFQKAKDFLLEKNKFSELGKKAAKTKKEEKVEDKPE